MPDGADRADRAEQDIWEGGGRRYRMEKVVGNGAFGVVWRAREEGSTETVAIKKVVLDRRYHNRELEMMKCLEHECVIRLHHHFEKPGRKRDETFLHLVMDFLPETIRSVSLSFQKDRARFPVEHVRVYLYQTLKALEYVHGKRICHRDLKPDNLLVDPARLQLKLIDFGCAKVLVKGQPNVSYICSRYYRAPELMFGATEYTCAVDMWSVGTILVELLLGHLPFQGQDSTQQHLVEIMKLLGTPTDKELRGMRATCLVDELPKLKAYPWERVFPSGTPQKAMDLAFKLLTYDPSHRLTATQALQHPFFDGIDVPIQEAGGFQSTEETRALQIQLTGLFDNYAAARTSALQGMLPNLQSTIGAAAAHQQPASDALPRCIASEVTRLLHECERAEQSAYSDLRRKVLKFALNGGGFEVAKDASSASSDAARPANPPANPDLAAQLQQQVMQAKEEAAAMRAERDALRAQLAAGNGGASNNSGGLAEGATPGEADARNGGPPSYGRRAVRHLNDGAQGVASPLVPRPSMAAEVGDEPQSAPRARNRGLHVSSLPEDEMGQVTPVGVAADKRV